MPAASVACLSLAAPASAASVELVDDGGFEAAGSFSKSSTAMFSAWRFFTTTSWATGSATSDAASGGKAFHLALYSTSGDAGLDKYAAGLRPFVQPGRTYRLTFQAKSPQARQVLVRMPLFNTSGSVLVGTPEFSFPLSTFYQRFSTTFVAPSGANSADLAFRMTGGTGDLYLDDISLTEVTTTVPPSPRVVLPTGSTTSLKPRIEWRTSGEPSAYEVIVSTGPSPTSGVVGHYSALKSTRNYHVPEADLPTSQTLYAFVRVQNTFGWSEWSRELAPFRVEPVEQADGTLYLYDLFYTNWESADVAYDQAHVASALQGLVNREKPRLYIDLIMDPDGRRVDTYWLNRMREPGAWLEKMTLQTLPDLPALVNQFRSDIRGVVLWDQNVPATSNVASTVAGVEGLLPVCYDTTPGSAWSQIVAGGPQLPVVANLVGKFTGSGQIPDIGRSSSGSAKCDAYLWAKALYLDTGKCSPLHMGYYVDAYWLLDPTAGGLMQNHMLTNHDFFIAHKGFFWDLSPWRDEVPVDDPGQPLGTDLATLKEILSSAYAGHGGQGFTHVGGFTPWSIKYTNYGTAGGTREPVPTEWETARILTSYNAYLDADALGQSGTANGSLLQLMPLPARYVQPAPPTPQELRDRGLLDQVGRVAAKSYLLHYVGDYDATAWVMNMLPWKWDAAERGSVPMAWAVNPNLSLRARPFFEYAFRTRTGADNFIAGDSGAGYVTPTEILAPRSSGLPDGTKAWQDHCSRFFQAFGYSFTGFVLNGHAGPVTPEAEEIYRSFSGDGIITQYGATYTTPHLTGTMPAVMMRADLGGDLAADSSRLNGLAKVGTADFLAARSVLKEISYYAGLNARVQAEHGHKAFVFTTPQEFSYLARQHLGGQNTTRATYLFDTLPERWQISTTKQVEVAVRNDGWETWAASGSQAHTLAVEFSLDGVRRSPSHYPLPRDVGPGDSVVMKIDISAPDEPGDYQVAMEMVRGGTEWFSTKDDAALISPSEVVTEPVPVTLSGFSIE